MKTIIKYLGCVLMLLAVTKASVPLYAATDAMSCDAMLSMSCDAMLSMSCVAKEKNRVTENAIDSVLVNGHMRHYRMVLPKMVQPNTPLVVLLHGYGGGNLNDETCMDSVAQRCGFALCVPAGLYDPKGK